MIGEHEKVILTRKEFNNLLFSKMYQCYDREISSIAGKPKLKILIQDLPAKSFIKLYGEEWTVTVVTYESERWGDDYFIGSHKNLLTAVSLAWLSWKSDKQYQLK